MKLIIGDRDPWHLSVLPLVLMIGGLFVFFLGGFQLIFGAIGWWWIATAAGFVCFVIGGVAAIREKLALDRIIEEREQELGP